MTNDVEIGTVGEHRIYMSFKDIKKIANKEISKRLQKATEALRFYADSDCYEKCGSSGMSEIDEDGGEWAQKVLEEIEK